MTEQNRALTARWFEEVWNQGKLETIDELFAADGLAFGFPTPDDAIDHGAFKAAVANFRTIFPDIHFSVADTIADGNKLAVRWTATMTHTGPGLGIAPTGAHVKVSGISIMETRDGQMTKGWNALDLTAMKNRLKAIAAVQL